SRAPVEAQPDGPAVPREVVRVLPGPRPDARGHRHLVRPLVDPPVGRQEALAPQRPPARPGSDPPQEDPPAEDQAARPVEKGQVRRRGGTEGPQVHRGALLTAVAPDPSLSRPGMRPT